MLKRAPSVYVPVDPDDDGVALPALLSLIVHGAILAFIVFFHRIPTLDTNDTIETSIVTPGELAAIQAEIAANRSALAAGNSDTLPSVNTDTLTSDTSEAPSYSPPMNTRSIDTAPRDISQPNLDTAPPPVFARSDEPADDFDMPEDNGLDEEVRESRRTFDDAQAAYERQLEEEMQREQDKANTKLNSSAPAKTNKPVTETFPAPAAGQNGTSKHTAAGGKSKGQIAGELLNYIKPKWNPDQKFVGTRITAYITVDEQGNVLTVTTNAQDQALGDSLIAAIKQASPLTPIAGSGYTKLEPVFVVNKK